MNILPLLATLLLSGVGATDTAATSVNALDSDPARWYPAESLLYFGSVGWDATGDAAARTPGGKLWNSDRLAPLRRGLPQIIWKLIEQEAKIDIDQETTERIKDLLGIALGCPVAFGVAGVEIDPLEPMVHAYAVIDAGAESETLLALLDRAIYATGIIAEDPEIRDIAGDRFRVLTASDDTPFDLLYGISRGALIVGVGEESIRFATSCADGKLPSLLASSRWQRGMERSIHDATPTSAIHIDIPGILDLVLGTMEEFGGELPLEMVTLVDEFVGRFGPVHLASGIEDEGFVGGWDIPFADLPGVGRPLELSDFRSAPRDGIFQIAGTYNLADSWDWMKSLLEMNTPEENRWQIDQTLKAVKATLGVEPRDLYTAIGDRILIYEETRARGLVPALVVSLAGGEPALIEQSVRQMGQMVSMFSGEVGVRIEEKKLDTGNGLVRWFQVFGQPVPIAPAWTIRDGELLIALHPTVIEETLRPREDGMAGSAIDLAALASEAGSSVHPTTAMSIDIGELMKEVWPSLTYGIQSLLGESVRLGVPLDASILPPASAFEDWQVVSVYFDDATGSRGFIRTPFPSLGECWAGLPVLGLAVPMLSQEKPTSEAVEDSDPEPTEKEKKSPRKYF